MTQEQKAKAYDEALEKAKIEINTKGIGETVNLCEQLFPELAKSDDEESEDERIRKFLIQHISEWIGCIEHDLKHSSKDIESEKELAMFKAGLAYLEKQKESLPISETCKENANSFIDGIIEVRSFQRGMEEGRRLEKQKEQKPIECIEFDNEFEKQVSHLLASVLNGEWEYNEGFVKHVAQSLLGYAKNELKQELPLMGGDTDAYFDDLRITTKPLTSREWFDEGIKYAQRLQKEQKHNYCLYGGYPNVGRCRWCSAACSARLADVHTDEEKEYIRTIKSIISDFIRDKKPENLAYYQRIYDWLDGRHVPFSCGHEKGQPADPVFSKQEYESHPIISKDTTSTKPVEFDGKTLLYTADKSYQIGFRDGVASVKQEWSEEDEEMRDTCIDLLKHFPRPCGEVIGPWKDCTAWLKSLPEKFVLQPKQEWDVEDKLMIKCCLEAINVYKHKAKRGKFLPARFNIGGYLASPEKVESWLKFLPGRFNLQPKQEWSDEDEHRRDGIIQWLREYQEKFNPKYDSLSIESIESLIDWLKSLRPSWKPSEQEKGALRTAIHVLTEERNFPKAASQLQNILDAFEGKESRKDWKPSEEQMDRLFSIVAALRKYCCYDMADFLASIYHNLKKLM